MNKFINKKKRTFKKIQTRKLTSAPENNILIVFKMSSVCTDSRSAWEEEG